MLCLPTASLAFRCFHCFSVFFIHSSSHPSCGRLVLLLLGGGGRLPKPLKFLPLGSSAIKIFQLVLQRYFQRTFEIGSSTYVLVKGSERLGLFSLACCLKCFSPALQPPTIFQPRASFFTAGVKRAGFFFNSAKLLYGRLFALVHISSLDGFPMKILPTHLIFNFRSCHFYFQMCFFLKWMFLLAL